MNDFGFIIISASANETEKMLAHELKDLLLKDGKKVQIFTDKAKQSAGEIVLGDTARKQIECNGEYVIIAEKGSIYVKSDTYFGYKKAFDLIQERIKRNAPILGVRKNTQSQFTNADAEYYAYNKSGEFRVMYFNIYGWLDKGGILLRTRLQYETLGLYKPDCIGFQEFDDNAGATYRTTMTPYMEKLGYTQIPHFYEGNRNSTPIFYNANVLQPIEWGGEKYDDGMRDESKSITWALFSGKSKRFLFVNTHFAWPDPKPGFERTDKARQDDAKQLIRLVQALCKKFDNPPILIGGDLNCFYQSAPINILQDARFVWLYDTADVVREYGYHHYSIFDEEKGYYTHVSTGEKDYTKSMDFVFAYSYPVTKENEGEKIISFDTKIKAHSYLTAVDELSLLSSDHAPKIVDFSI